MSEEWELGQTPYQAEVHEPIVDDSLIEEDHTGDESSRDEEENGQTFGDSAGRVWYDVELIDDGDELRRYAVFATSAHEAREIALAQMPQPTTRVIKMHAEPAEDDLLSYDAVLR